MMVPTADAQDSRDSSVAEGGGSRPRIVVVGSLNVDYYAVVDRFPGPGETVAAVRSAVRFGGKGANQAVAASKLGARVDVIGCVGGDGAGSDYLRSLRERGVKTDGVRIVEDEPTGSAFITLDSDGENTIVVSPGANGCVGAADVLKSRDSIAVADVVLLQNEVPAEANTEACRIARESKTLVVYNPAPWLDERVASPLDADVWIANESEAKALAGRLAPSRLVTTRGASPTLVQWDGDEFEVPVDEVTVTDSVGAGDTFIGSFARRLASGDPVGDAVRYANRAASFTLRATGAQESMPSSDQVDSRGS
jgi:ribokinase